MDDFGRGKFIVDYENKITKIDSNIKYLSSNKIQRYLTPLIILRILTDYNNGDIVTTLFKYAITVNLINSNYPYVENIKHLHL